MANHVWTIRKPDKSYDAEDKKDRLRKGNAGDQFEAVAADHNNITDGDDMSGPNEASKLYIVCSQCGKKDREIDQVLRDKDGDVTAIVEVKSGGVKGKQFHAQTDIADQLGVELIYKLKSGDKGDASKEYLQNWGLSESNIIMV